MAWFKRLSRNISGEKENCQRVCGQNVKIVER
jgi:hypothetical protein